MPRTINVNVTGAFVSKSDKNAGVQGESNVTTLHITFDESWDGYSKRIIWRDANGANAVAVLLFDDLSGTDPLVFDTLIPSEPLALTGWCSFTVEGYNSESPGSIAYTVSDKLYVKANDAYYTPAEPTASQAAQLLDKINGIIAGNVEIAELVRSGTIKRIRLNVDGGLEVSLDGEIYELVTSSGHIILDESGNQLPQRTRMKFINATVTDQGGITVVSGIQGPQGIQGQPGEQGLPGLPGLKGDRGDAWYPTLDTLGNLTFTLSDTATPPPIYNIRGPQGVQGVQGIQGVAGSQGQQGIQGPRGIQGLPGEKGDTGDAGSQGVPGNPGSQGLPGLPGPEGPQGLRGDDGADGRSFTVLALYSTLLALQTAHPAGNAGDAYAVGTSANNVIYIWDVDSAEWVSVGALQGPVGPQGPGGAQGIQGYSGTIAVGTVSTGSPGTNATVSNSGTPEAAILNFTIPRGDKGVKGDQGVPGEPGSEGIQGPPGIQGIPGVDGKSAYASAQDGGFAGTESMFNSYLATVGNKADKKTPTAAGNLATLDVNGNLEDSGKKITDFDPAGTGASQASSAVSGHNSDTGAHSAGISGNAATATKLQTARSIFGKSFDGSANITDPVPIVNGGTGQTTVAGARNALGLGNTSGAVPIANGGTGATTAAAALTNLGAQPAATAINTSNIGVQAVNYAHYASGCDSNQITTSGHAMLRNEAFVSSESTPSVNGQINWQYG